MPLITLLTDFGAGSPYVAAMKGVILSINPAATLVDLTHGIPPQDVREGALVLEEVAEYFPPATIHVAVVDPGVGSDRAIVYAQIGTQRYVAPDNGLLSRLSRKTPPDEIVRLTNPRYWRQTVSATFHGRDIMAPAAAHLSLGRAPAELGVAAETLVELDWPIVRQSPGRIVGSILRIDSFGNLITDVTAEMLAAIPAGAALRTACRGAAIEGRVRTYADAPAGQPVVLLGSRGRLEIAVVDGNAAKLLRAGVGEEVVVEWAE
jgi:S-adenosylmethionine hydrolase